MKTLLNLSSFIALLLLMSCSEDSVTPPVDNEIASNLRVTVSDEVHNNQMQELSSGVIQSDPFQLKSAVVDTAKQELRIEVSYSGGCAEHDFEIIWPETILAIFPPVYPVILNHEDNGDMCEALPSETLIFDLTDTELDFNQFTINNMIVEVINGSNEDEVVRTDD